MNGSDHAAVVEVVVIAENLPEDRTIAADVQSGKDPNTPRDLDGSGDDCSHGSYVRGVDTPVA